MYTNFAPTLEDSSIPCNDKHIAKAIYKIIGQKLRLPGEGKDPFTYLGLVEDFNDVDVQQRKEYIQVNFPNYIKHLLISHGWFDNDSKSEPSSVNDPYFSIASFQKFFDVMLVANAPCFSAVLRRTEGMTLQV